MTNILLVEDNKNQCLLYEQELRHEGYGIVTANDGKEALEKVKGQLPDMIIWAADAYIIMSSDLT